MRLATLFVLGLVTALGGSATAGEMAGVTLPDRIQIGDKPLTLNGLGLREATFLKVDVYVAGLYLEHVSSNPQEILGSGEAKRLVLHFVRHVDRKDILKAWREGFAGNAGASVAALKPQIEQLDAWMSDFSKGDTLTFTYLPGQGVQVDIGTTRKGVIQGEDFAQALFAIWLGPKPPTGALKTGLLGSHR